MDFILAHVENISSNSLEVEKHGTITSSSISMGMGGFIYQNQK